MPVLRIDGCHCRRCYHDCRGTVCLGTNTATGNRSAVAVLQTLDKVTGRISTLRVPVGESAGFGTLTIVPRACRKRPPEEFPESAGFLEIDDAPPAGQPRRVFTGWMFASSPAVSAMEHPVFDVWVRDCIAAEAPGQDQPSGEAAGSN